MPVWAPAIRIPRHNVRGIPNVPNVDRIYVGDTERYVCNACDAWVVMERMADARGWERVDTGDGQVGWASIQPGPLDPPLQPTLYHCPRCGHEQVGLPSLKNPT
jgi:hypothetical protein